MQRGKERRENADRKGERGERGTEERGIEGCGGEKRGVEERS